MRFGSVCSGIEAASVAWPFWDAAWFSEIEPFPYALLKHHYPTVPNLGDMTALPDRILSGEVEAPDVFCGGTPCQAFSIAGNRRSLDDARGNLSLTFCEIANAIDTVRSGRGDRPAVIFWENVPGVLNTKDNAFGCFLAGLAGESVPLQPPGGKWTDAGCVLGPQRAVAWRTLDAQHFGLAQRRKRVFVVASARNGFNPGAVLFESEGVRRDTPPSRETGQTVAADVAGGVAVKDQRLVSFGEYVDDETASTMKMRDYKDATDLVCYNIIADDTPKITDEIAGALRANGSGGIVPSGVAYALQGGGATSQNGNGSGHNKDISFTLNATDVHGVVAFHPTHALGCGSSDGQASIAVAVRRLMPVECERLQGFPDNHTDVMTKGKPTADGPRYKAIGNSWAVPVVRWIGERIDNQLMGGVTMTEYTKADYHNTLATGALAGHLDSATDSMMEALAMCEEQNSDCY